MSQSAEKANIRVESFDTEVAPRMPEKVTPLGPDWPGRPLPVMPGDFSHYAPDGMGLSVPLVVRPWDSLEGAVRAQGHYGLAARETDPVRAAPHYDARGGVIYFDAGDEWQTLSAALMLMGVHLLEKDFAVFFASAAEPEEQRYADQARIIRRSTLAHLYGVRDEVGALQPQTATVGDYIQQFLAEQRDKWDGGGAFSPAMYGMFGGDGDWAKEDLCFGFMVENGYLGVYRIWSRAWLVTK
ncbi:MAG: hypothetical protein QM780_02770 [Hyphomicrobium sp.]|uniref:hypothetical protein n=1 Tax=Hyphomicrobium sp. TaxID=82 RepID=UPI0039E3D76D